MKPWMAFSAGAALAAMIAAVIVTAKRESSEAPPTSQVISQETVSVTESREAPSQPLPAEASRVEPVDRKRRAMLTASRTEKPEIAAPVASGTSQTIPRGEASPSGAPAATTGTNASNPGLGGSPGASSPAATSLPAPAVGASSREPEPAPPPKPEPRPEPNRVTLPAGTVLSVRLAETLSSEAKSAGQTFQATLVEPLVAEGFVVAERGAKVEGRVVEAVPAGRVKGVSRLSLELTHFYSSDGQRVPIHTEIFGKEGETSRKNDAAKVAAGAAVGAALGAIFGGGKGAAIGASSGAAAGTGVVLATRGKEVVLPVETKLNFKTTTPVTLTERR
ncbi:MAG: hypothetical protein NZV14_07175 [Bryobacteraceae bacterium]|nr:hypothetical protein [Bryobacteraceae bacterium]MDW8377925.1 hypothetical protein [Bryobacterales bacterium]